MTVADKLEYTKMGIDDIQLAINEKGVQVSSAVPLGEYGDKIREITGDTTGNFPDFLYDFIMPIPNTWSTKKAMSTARVFATASIFNGVIYCIGGYNNTGTTTINEAYDTLTNTWSTKANMPSASHFLTSEVYNGVVYCIGGHDGSGVVNFNQAYDILTNTWSAKAEMPSARYGLVSSTHNGAIYCFGGYYGYDIASNITQVYNISTNTWNTTKKVMPTARGGFAASICNGVVYCIGGYNGSAIININQAYDIATDTWSTKASMPTIRDGIASEIYNGVIYCFGGGYGIKAVEAYDVVTNTWSFRYNIPTSRAGMASSIKDNVIYTIGGAIGAYEGPAGATNEAYTITETSLGKAKAGDVIFSSSPIRVGNNAVSANYETTLVADGEIYPVTDYIGSLILIRKKSVGVWLQNLTPYKSGATLALLKVGNVIFTDSTITLDGTIVEKLKKITITKDSVLKFYSSNVVSLLWIN